MTHNKEWHDRRARGIGGSDIAAVVGISNFKTRREVWLEKTGRLNPQPATAAMKRGTLIEPFACEEYTNETGESVLERSKYCIHPQEDIVRCELDGTLPDNRILEIKCPNSQVWQHYRLYGIPDHYQCQAQWNMLASGAAECVFWVFSADAWAGFVVTVPADVGVQESLLQQACEFWGYVDRDEAPPEDAPEQDTEPVKMPDAPDGEIVTIEDAEWNETIQHLAEFRDMRDKADELYKAMQEQVQELMTKHNATIAEGGGARIYWRESTRQSLDTKRLKKEQPDIAKKYMRETTTRSFRPYFNTKGREL